MNHAADSASSRRHASSASLSAAASTPELRSRAPGAGPRQKPSRSPGAAPAPSRRSSAAAASHRASVGQTTVTAPSDEPSDDASCVQNAGAPGRFASQTTPVDRRTPAKGPVGFGFFRSAEDLESRTSRSRRRAAASAAAADFAAASAAAADADAAARAAASAPLARTPRCAARADSDAASAASAARRAARGAADGAEPEHPEPETETSSESLPEPSSSLTARRGKYAWSVRAKRPGWNGRLASYTIGGASASSRFEVFASSDESSAAAAADVAAAAAESPLPPPPLPPPPLPSPRSSVVVARACAPTRARAR